MSDREPPVPETKLTRTKRRWADEGQFLTGQTLENREKALRLPPGQHLVSSWPVLDLGVQPEVPRAAWRLEVARPGAEPFILDWNAFLALPQSEVISDIHCVTTWSRYDNLWQGVRTRDLLSAAGVPAASGGFVMLHGYDGYTTNLPLADFAAADALLAHHWQGQPIAREHGGPARLVVPHLYFWKSAKWIRRMVVMDKDEPGYWECNGYHMRGDPWREERYSSD